MNDYRQLTDDEIITLVENGCRAEYWACVYVAEDFNPSYVHNVMFFGTVCLGVFEQYIDTGNNFMKHSALRNATLHNVVIGDNCLIENIGNYIDYYTIGDECYISNVSTIATTAGATFGEGQTISVLKEAIRGNVMLFSGLTSNIAALMVNHSADKVLLAALKTIIRNDVKMRSAKTGIIGNRVRIVNTTEIINTNISDGCEVNGACRLSDCTLTAEPDDSVYIGSGVICENSIVADGSSILNSAKIFHCYVGEACRITNGFTAESSLFFANTYMANGEASVAFCGPFSASHHKSTLLIGCMVSFYNAGSATNFSNHAYKMGPIHYGVLERGTKTASGSHILLPATIGAFSVCMGKTSTHPDTRSLPFSYVIGDGRETTVVPGKVIATVGLYRDVRKWPRRDIRMSGSKKSLINYDWLSPLTVNEIMKGREVLRRLQETQGGDAVTYSYNGCKISGRSLLRGLRLYDMAVELFIGEVLMSHDAGDPCTPHGTGEWCDLSGLLLPASEEERLIGKIKYGAAENIKALADMLSAYNDMYGEYLWTYTVSLMKTYLGKDELTEDDFATMRERGKAARRAWLDEIRKDAEKEYSMGDVDRVVLDNFIELLD
mgnify:CR=1 FL=1